MLDSSHEVNLGEIETMNLDATPFVVAMWATNLSTVLAVDPRRNEFVRLPLMHDGSRRVLGLSPDGRQMLILSGSERRQRCVGLEELATGTHRWLDQAQGGVYDGVAAMSPDGKIIAVLSTQLDPADADASFAIISLVDVTSGERRRLWRATGSWSAETAIGWSPDQQYLAATYYDTLPGTDEQWITVVVDLDGTERHRIEFAAMAPPSNEAWLGSHELLYVDNEDWTLTSLSTLEGNRRKQLNPAPGIPIARIRDRLVWHHWRTAEEGAGLETTQLDGNDVRQLMTVVPGGQIYRVALASRLIME